MPGQQPANRSQEKEFVQAYEDVLERYKGAAAGGRPGDWPEPGPAAGGAAGGVAPTGAGAGPEPPGAGTGSFPELRRASEPSPTWDGAFIALVTFCALLSGSLWKEARPGAVSAT